MSMRERAPSMGRESGGEKGACALARRGRARDGALCMWGGQRGDRDGVVAGAANAGVESGRTRLAEPGRGERREWQSTQWRRLNLGRQRDGDGASRSEEIRNSGGTSGGENRESRGNGESVGRGDARGVRNWVGLGLLSVNRKRYISLTSSLFRRAVLAMSDRFCASLRFGGIAIYEMRINDTVVSGNVTLYPRIRMCKLRMKMSILERNKKNSKEIFENNPLIGFNHNGD